LVRSWLLTIHVLAAVLWIATAACLAILDYPTAGQAVEPAGVVLAARMTFVPLAAVVLLTGCELARRWVNRWPIVVMAQLGSAVIVLALTALLVMVHPAYVWIVRLVQLTILFATFGLAVRWRPQPVPRGKHHKPARSR
jgi:hypothetical protein